MKKTLSRSMLHPEIQWYQFDENLNKIVLNRQDINEAINFWKIILSDHGFSEGNKLGPMLSSCDIKYFSLLFATLELGGSLCVMDKPQTVSGVLGMRSRVFAPIDIIVTNNTPSDVEQAVCDQYAEKHLYSDLWHTYTSNNFSAKDVFADYDNGIALVGTSSGTTGTPKPILYTHEFLYATAYRCSKVLHFKEDDKILHLSNLHHGGSAGIFFFPSLIGSKHHYFEYGLAPGAIQKIIDIVIREKINKIMFPNSLLLEEFITTVPPLTHRIDLYTLQSKVKSWLPHVKRANINSIYSVFGSTEVLGPVFENMFTINDDPETFDVLNYGKPLDNFFQVHITDDGKLSVTVQNKKTFLLNDEFNINHNGDYVFQGRTDLVRVNDISMSILFLEMLAAKYFDATKAFLVPDATTNKLYLLCSPLLNDGEFEEKKIKINKELKNINGMLKIDFVSFDPIEQFVDQIKFSRDLAKTHFRKKFKLL